MLLILSNSPVCHLLILNFIFHLNSPFFFPSGFQKDIAEISILNPVSKLSLA